MNESLVIEIGKKNITLFKGYFYNKKIYTTNFFDFQFDFDLFFDYHKHNKTQISQFKESILKKNLDSVRDFIIILDPCMEEIKSHFASENFINKSKVFFNINDGKDLYIKELEDLLFFLFDDKTALLDITSRYIGQKAAINLKYPLKSNFSYISFDEFNIEVVSVHDNKYLNRCVMNKGYKHLIDHLSNIYDKGPKLIREFLNKVGFIKESITDVFLFDDIALSDFENEVHSYIDELLFKDGHKSCFNLNDSLYIFSNISHLKGNELYFINKGFKEVIQFNIDFIGTRNTSINNHFGALALKKIERLVL